MHILVAGLNYRTAPVEIREKFTIPEKLLPDALKSLRETKSVLECVIVGTCNRTELYAVVDRLDNSGAAVRSFLEKWFDIPDTFEFTKHFYIYEDQKAIRHLFRVVSGLDSMVIGETQILGQVKDAFLLAQSEKATGTIFNTLFKQAVTFAKRVHTETSIGENPVSVSYAAVELGKRIFGTFKNKSVMIIGAGKMSELTVKHLRSGGAQKIIVVNRTYRRAEELAAKIGGIPCTMEQMIAELANVDIVISSTGAPGLVLTRDQVQSSRQKRKSSRPLFMIDIAVPRDLDPAIGELSGVYLYDIDDLQSLVDSNLEERRREAVRIEEMIGDEILQFEGWYKTLGVRPVIRALQEKSNSIHEETLDDMLKKLPDLTEREVKVIRKLTKSIVNQMLRDPIVRIKEMAADRNGDQALKMFAQIFALEELLEQQKRLEQAAPDSRETVKPAESKEKMPDGALQSGELVAGT